MPRPCLFFSPRLEDSKNFERSSGPITAQLISNERTHTTKVTSTMRSLARRHALALAALTIYVMLLSQRRTGSSPKLLMGRYERTKAFRTLTFSAQSQSTELTNQQTTDNLRLLETVKRKINQLKEYKELLAAKQNDLKIADAVHHGRS